MHIWKPTAAECAAIREAAAREARSGGGRVTAASVVLQPGLRVHDTEEEGPVLNIALLTADPYFNDTDLFDYGTWQEFRAGVLLASDGRAIVDFYLYQRGDEQRNLLGNITVEYSDGQVRRIRGYGAQRDGTYQLPAYKEA